LKQIFC